MLHCTVTHSAVCFSFLPCITQHRTLKKNKTGDQNTKVTPVFFFKTTISNDAILYLLVY